MRRCPLSGMEGARSLSFITKFLDFASDQRSNGPTHPDQLHLTMLEWDQPGIGGWGKTLWRKVAVGAGRSVEWRLVWEIQGGGG